MLFTIEERMDFDLLNSINIMQLCSQIRDEVINRKHESMISVDDLEKVVSLKIGLKRKVSVSFSYEEKTNPDIKTTPIRV